MDDIEKQFDLDHLFLTERTCRVCGESKDLVSEFYLTRKGRGDIPSAYSYECKICTIKRIVKNRRYKKPFTDWIYPDR